jgi:hypothetical protein
MYFEDPNILLYPVLFSPHIIMTLPVMPETLQDWNIDVIDNLIKILSIESETFDFKGSHLYDKDDELYNDICAMANTSGGLIVLGINEIKIEGKTKRFEKNGFEAGDEDKVNQQIASSIYNIEPTPKIEQRSTPIYDDDGKRFYPLIKINSVTDHKPYFNKNRGQCYVRIGNSSRPASRTTVLNLFSDYREKKVLVEGLRVAAVFAKESLIAISRDLEESGDVSIIPAVDLESLKRAVASNEWLLSQKRLLGGHYGNDHKSQELGAYYYLRELDTLNQHLDIHNSLHDTATNQQIKRDLCEKKFWCPGRQRAKDTILFLDSLASRAKEYLDKEMH